MVCFAVILYTTRLWLPARSTHSNGSDITSNFEVGQSVALWGSYYRVFAEYQLSNHAVTIGYKCSNCILF